MNFALYSLNTKQINNRSPCKIKVFPRNNRHAPTGNQKKPSAFVWEISNFLYWLITKEGHCPKWIQATNTEIVRQVYYLYCPGLSVDLLEEYRECLPHIYNTFQRSESSCFAIANGYQGAVFPSLSLAVTCNTPQEYEKRKEKLEQIKPEVQFDIKKYEKAKEKGHSKEDEEEGGDEAATKIRRTNQKNSKIIVLKKPPKSLKISPLSLCLTKTELSDNEYPGYLNGLNNDTKDYITLKSIENSKYFPNYKGLVPHHLLYVSIDCEMVETTIGMELVRISVASSDTTVIYDKLVLPSSRIVDYKTEYSGINKERLVGVKMTLKKVQKEIQKLIPKESIIIGHSLENDLRAIKLKHDKVIDTSIIYDHSQGYPLKPSLKWLAKKYLNEIIQTQFRPTNKESDDQKENKKENDQVKEIVVENSTIKESEEVVVPEKKKMKIEVDDQKTEKKKKKQKEKKSEKDEEKVKKVLKEKNKKETKKMMLEKNDDSDSEEDEEEEKKKKKKKKKKNKKKKKKKEKEDEVEDQQTEKKKKIKKKKKKQDEKKSKKKNKKGKTKKGKEENETKKKKTKEEEKKKKKKKKKKVEKKKEKSVEEKDKKKKKKKNKKKEKKELKEKKKKDDEKNKEKDEKKSEKKKKKKKKDKKKEDEETKKNKKKEDKKKKEKDGKKSEKKKKKTKKNKELEETKKKEEKQSKKSKKSKKEKKKKKKKAKNLEAKSEEKKDNGSKRKRKRIEEDESLEVKMELEKQQTIQKHVEKDLSNLITIGHSSNEDALASLKLVKLKLTLNRHFGLHHQNFFEGKKESLFRVLSQKNINTTVIARQFMVQALTQGTNSSIAKVTANDNDQVFENLNQQSNFANKLIWAELPDLMSIFESNDTLAPNKKLIRKCLKKLDKQYKDFTNQLSQNSIVIFCTGNGNIGKVRQIQNSSNNRVKNSSKLQELNHLIAKARTAFAFINYFENDKQF
ncbi:hypothetical protein M0813_26738 [Anaeramoeba flamelloides]|uniref:Exonuclease domain-containing protein n=1 Tax=Anaeramoeba flamelloides TaxID=1746091 RepID=A0ABQ8XYP7_9EUKA|nr:hypothetical protein M0813_26738 [Anaeramoeba flamelloides]